MALWRGCFCLNTCSLERKTIKHLASILILACTMLCSVPSRAEPWPDQQSLCSPEHEIQWRGGTLWLENDLFAGTDRNYTNGVALALVSHDMEGKLKPECLPWALGLYTRFLGWADPRFWRRAGTESATQNIVMRAGQLMYTPGDNARTDLISDDRPYAGLLYMSMAWNRRVHPQDATYDMLDVRELTLGVIGPWSFAEQSQNLVHRARGIDRFNGWGNQLRNEPAFQLSLERKFKAYASGAIKPGWGSDLVGNYGLRFGNIKTEASAGVELRAGWNIPNDFGGYALRPGAENRPPSAAAKLRTAQSKSTTAPRPGTHVFINLEGKAVGWDFSLDGNLFNSSHSVSRRPWVGQAVIGISSQWIISGHGVRLALMRVWRTREFNEQIDRHAFGSIALSFEI
ncbi:MAG: lipid A deacylase LpxR family protein [Thiohalomonadaceae bacterium]